AAPDILVLQGVDWDFEGRALRALSDGLDRPFPYVFSQQPNTGVATDFDMDGDGRRFGPRDAQGYGTFRGQGGMAVLSRYPIRTKQARAFSTILWQDIPGAALPTRDGAPFPSADAQAAQRLSSVAHWAVPIETPDGVLTILAWHGSTPAFDGPEDKNGKRGGDEARFWQLYLDGAFGPVAPNPVVIGQSNIDPNKGEGQRAVMARLLADARLQDPTLLRAPTVNWPQTGPMRASYILPAAHLRVTRAAIEPRIPEASRHSLIWADIIP
ncbi:MAG: endonuclease/exonuclease/phosphatase family protein, partial [Pseudomonadota bacterium]